MSNNKDSNLDNRNTINWASIPVDNLERAMKFYSAIFGEELQKQAFPLPDGTEAEFVLLPRYNDNVSGLLSVMPGRKPSSDGALIYLNMDGRMDSAESAVAAAGGKIVEERKNTGHGYMTLAQDSEGNIVALHAFNP